MTHRPLHLFIPHCSDLLTDHLPHGDGLVAHGFIRHLALRGHTLHVAAQRVALHDPLPPNVRLTVISPSTSNRALARLQYMAGVRRHFHRLRRTVPLDLIHQLNPVFSGVSLGLMPARLPVILGTFVPRWPYDPATLSARPGLPGLLSGYARDILAGLQQRHAKVLLLTSPASHNRLPNLAAVSAKVRWLAHGIDAEAFAPAPALSEISPSILFLASLSERKGLFTLLEAMPAVLARIPACRLTLAGEGADALRAHQLVAQLGLARQVSFLGRVDRAVTPALYRSHAIYCLPSHGEPHATSILEAMSCGRPIVLTNSGGLPYMVPETGGLRVPPGDPAALAAALIELLEDPVRRAVMGAVNRAAVLESFTWPQVIRRLEEVYFEALNPLSLVRTTP